MAATASVCAVALLLPACATRTVSSTTWSSPPPQWARPGHVEAVQQVVERVQGQPVGGALAGALIGGMLFGGRRGAGLFGAAAGAAVGAAASSGSSEHRRWNVYVRFYDGALGTFVYTSPPPFGPGQPVVQTPQGLSPQ